MGVFRLLREDSSPVGLEKRRAGVVFEPNETQGWPRRLALPGGLAVGTQPDGPQPYAMQAQDTPRAWPRSAGPSAREPELMVCEPSHTMTYEQDTEGARALTADLVEDTAALLALREEWATLHQATGGSSPYAQWAWA